MIELMFFMIKKKKNSNKFYEKSKVENSSLTNIKMLMEWKISMNLRLVKDQNIYYHVRDKLYFSEFIFLCKKTIKEMLAFMYILATYKI